MDETTPPKAEPTDSTPRPGRGNWFAIVAVLATCGVVSLVFFLVVSRSNPAPLKLPSRFNVQLIEGYAPIMIGGNGQVVCKYRVKEDRKNTTRLAIWHGGKTVRIDEPTTPGSWAKPLRLNEGELRGFVRSPPKGRPRNVIQYFTWKEETGFEWGEKHAQQDLLPMHVSKSGAFLASPLGETRPLFLVNGDEQVELSTIGGPEWGCWGNSINDHGDVCGVGHRKVKPIGGRGWVYMDGEFRWLPKAKTNEKENVEPLGMNNTGLVVGKHVGRDENGKAYTGLIFWELGLRGRVELTKLPEGMYISRFLGVTDAGWIALICARFKPKPGESQFTLFVTNQHAEFRDVAALMSEHSQLFAATKVFPNGTIIGQTGGHSGQEALGFVLTPDYAEAKE